jgi:hypothetical protein
MGLGDWQNQTPGGNDMGDPGGGTILTLTKSNQTVENIARWYFYRKHIVGQTNSDYFIVDEATGKVQRFSEFGQWNEVLAQMELSPTVWTRWYSDNWKFFERMLFAIFFIGLVILLPLLFFLFRGLNRWITNDSKFELRKSYLIAFVAIVVVIIARTILDIYPQSI